MDFSGKDLRYAALYGVDLIEADLTFADIRYADLSGADLDDTNLELSLYNDFTIWPAYFEPGDYELIFRTDAYVDDDN